MPIYEYQARDPAQSCEHCVRGFEIIQKIADASLEQCPRCGAPVSKQISAPSVGHSRTGLDDRAKSAGFHKLKRVSKGEYEKAY